MQSIGHSLYPSLQSRVIDVRSLTIHSGSGTKEQLVIQAFALSLINNHHWFQSTMITSMNSVLSFLAGQDLYDLWHTCFGHLLKNAL